MRRILLLVLFLVPPALPAQEIMSFEEYQELRHAEPYIVETDNLLYFGSRHSFNPQDEQMSQIEEAWNRFKPDIAYAEGGSLAAGLTRDEAIKSHGEFGVVRLLALRDEVPVHSLDPERKQEVDYLKERWDDGQLMLFFTLRRVAQARKQGAAVDLSVVVPRYLQSLEERFGLDGPLTLEEIRDAVARLLPSVDDWRQVPEHYFYPGPQDPSYFTHKIATDSNIFRDRFHVQLVTREVSAGKRVFAIVGFGPRRHAGTGHTRAAGLPLKIRRRQVDLHEALHSRAVGKDPVARKTVMPGPQRLCAFA